MPDKAPTNEDCPAPDRERDKRVWRFWVYKPLSCLPSSAPDKANVRPNAALQCGCQSSGPPCGALHDSGPDPTPYTFGKEGALILTSRIGAPMSKQPVRQEHVLQRKVFLPTVGCNSPMFPISVVSSTSNVGQQRCRYFSLACMLDSSIPISTPYVTTQYGNLARDRWSPNMFCDFSSYHPQRGPSETRMYLLFG